MKLLHFALLALCFILPGCSSNQSPPAATQKQAQNTEQTPATPPKQTQSAVASKVRQAAPLIEYLQSLKPLAQEVEKEFMQIQEAKGTAEDIRKLHWTLDKKIKAIDITGLYYPNHTELSGHIALAHKYNVYLWQAYQNNDAKEIADNKALIQAALSDFKKMSAKIESGEIEDVYNGPQ